MTNRNSNAHFELAPQAAIERSTFDRSCNIHTSFNVGDLVPFYVDEVLPGDTFQITTSKVARLQTLIAPVMDNLYLDTYYFFVPNRLVWEHWQNFCGESTEAWTDLETWEVPKFVDNEGLPEGCVADYMGVPTQTSPSTSQNGQMEINVLPFRAYALIWNDWFRDENLQDPLLIYKGDDFTYSDGSYGDKINSTYVKGKPLKANKYHDYFTSCLPGPLKGEDVSILSGYVPVRAVEWQIANEPSDRIPVSVRNQVGGIVGKNRVLFVGQDDSILHAGDEYTGSSQGNMHFSNLAAILDNAKQYDAVTGSLIPNSSFTVNGLRQAFQIQRMLEKDARGGTRYIEILKSHFNVTSPDSRLQRPEYLGGNRIPLNIEQVINTTANQQAGLLPGDASGWSQTSDSHYDVEKSFVEHGFIIGLMCARYDHTYQQGLERMWSRQTRYDYYWPALAHLGEKAVYMREIWNDDPAVGNQVFGYQEAWAEYRYKPNYVTGAMRTNAKKSLDIWHFADYYGNNPTLSAAWIAEDKSNVDRALTVKSTVENQIFMDIYVKNKATRPMPLYSIPGLIDHF